MDKVEEAVIGKIREITGRDDVTAESSFIDDIPLTSVNAMKLSFDIENELGCKEIPQEIFFSLETVNDLIETVRDLL